MTAREDFRQSSLGIRRLKTRLHDAASRAETVRRERGEVQANLQQLTNEHSEWAKYNSRQSTLYLFVLLGVTVVYFIDIMLFGPTAEMLSEKAFYGMPAMTWVGRLLVPAAILLLEIYVALLIYSSKRDSESYYTVSNAQHGWLLVGILFAIVMPSFVVGTNLVQSSFEGQSLQTGLRWQLIGLVILAIVMHVPIIFGGRIAHEAKSFFSFKAKHTSYQRRSQEYNKKYDSEVQLFRSNFDAFFDLLNRHRQTFQDNYDPGPFDSRTRNFAREIYGYAVIQMPDAPMQAPTVQNTDIDMPNQNIEPSQASDGGNGNGQMPEETADVDTRIREKESEVSL